MAQTLALSLTIDGKERTIKDIREIRALLQSLGDLPESEPGIDSLLGKVPRLAFAFNEVNQAAQNALNQLKPLYDLLIGSNEQLNQQLLQSAATIAATSDILQNGIKIEDPTAAIEAVQPQIKAAIAEVERATQDLVGVTSEQTSSVLNTILTNVSQLNDQLQGLGGTGQEFASGIDAASKLAPGLVATLGTLQLPLDQANQEIRSLLQGIVTEDVQIAKRLGITSDDLARWKQAGTLAAELNKRFEPFVKANQLGARSIAGITSNLQDIVEVSGRTAGAPLLDILVDQLDQVYQLVKQNQNAITEETVKAVQTVTQILNAAIEAVSQIAQAATPAVTAVGEALGDAFDTGAVTAVNTIESLSSLITGLIQIATPFIQIVSTITTGLAELGATDAGQTLIQFSLAAAGLNLALPTLLGGINGLFGAVNKLETTFNNLLPLLAQTNAAKTGLAAKEAALALATGTTTAAIQAEAVARARMTVGDTAGAAAALEVAAAERAKAISIQQSTLAMVGNIAKMGLLAGAVGSVALAVNQFQQITEEARATEEGIKGIDSALAKLAEARAQANEANAKGAEAAKEAVQANIALIQQNLGPVTLFLDQVIRFINATIEQLNKLLDSPVANFIPGLKDVKTALDAIGAEGIPKLGTAADAAITQAKGSFNELKVATNKLFQDIGASAKAADGSIQFPSLVGKSKEELDAYKAAVDANLQALRESKPTTEEDLRFKQQNIALLEAAKKQLEANAGSVKIQSKELANQGTIYQVLNKNLQNAQRTLATSNDQTQLNNAAKDAADLIQQLFELGQISADQAKQQLAAIAKNGKVEVGARQSAQEAIGKIEDSAIEKSISAFTRKSQEIDRLESQGIIDSDEAQKRRTANEKAQIDARLKAVQAAITAEQQAISQGRGSDSRLKDLQKQQQELITEGARASAANEQASYQQRLNQLQRYLDQANSEIQLAETERSTIIQQELNKGQKAQEEIDLERLQSTRQTLSEQLALEQENLKRLQALPQPSDPDEERDRQSQIRQSRQQTASLTLQLLENEYEQQQKVRDLAIQAIQDRLEETRKAFDAIKAESAKAVLAIEAQGAALERQQASQSAIVGTLDRQSKLLQARQGLQESLNNLSRTEAKIRLDSISEYFSLEKQRNQEQSGAIRTLINQRMLALGLSTDDNSLARESAQIRRKEAEAELQRALQKQKFDRLSLELQQQQEATQARLAVIEAKRNELAAQKQIIDAKQSASDAQFARAEAQSQLEQAQQIADPKQQQDAIDQAQRQIAAADQQFASAQQSATLAQQGLDIAQQQTKEAEIGVTLQQQTAELAERTLVAQQANERALAQQAKDAEVFAANMQLALIAAGRVSEAMGGGGGSIPQRRTGGDIQPGQLYQVHRDELFVSNQGGYMLNRRDAMRVASEALQGGSISLPAAQSIGQSGAGPNLIAAIGALQSTLKGVNSGVQVGTLHQSIVNKVPQNEAAIAQMVEQAHLNLLQDLKKRLRQ